MRLSYQHNKAGPGPVVIRAPRDLPVFVTIDGRFDHRSVEILLSDRTLAAWAGPSGPRSQTLSIEVGTPSTASFLRDFFGFRSGVSVSDGGVVASGAGSIVSGGDITGCATGRGSVVTGKNENLSMETGVHLFLPFQCEFDVKSNNAVTVTVGEQMVNLDSTNNCGH